MGVDDTTGSDIFSVALSFAMVATSSALANQSLPVDRKRCQCHSRNGATDSNLKKICLSGGDRPNQHVNMFGKGLNVMDAHLHM